MRFSLFHGGWGWNDHIKPSHSLFKKTIHIQHTRYSSVLFFPMAYWLSTKSTNIMKTVCTYCWSWISQRRGCQLPGGAPTYYFAKFLLTTACKWNERGHASLTLLSLDLPLLIWFVERRMQTRSNSVRKIIFLFGIDWYAANTTKIIRWKYYKAFWWEN